MKYHLSINCRIGMEYLKLGTPIPGKTNRESFYIYQERIQKGIKYYTGCDSEDTDGSCKGHPDDYKEPVVIKEAPSEPAKTD